MNSTPRRPKILLVSSVPTTLWAFYRRMPETASQWGIDLGIASSPERELDDFADQLGVTTHPVAITRAVSPWADLRAIARLCRIIRRHRYDLVHAFTPKGGLVGMLAAALAGAPCKVYSMIGLPAETATGILRKLLVTSERTACHFAQAVLANGPSLQTVISEMGICQVPKMRVLGDGSCCGIKLDRFRRTPERVDAGRCLRRDLGIPEGAPVIGYVGRLVYDKGIHVLVDAFEALDDRRPPPHLLLLGSFEPHRGRLPPHTLDRIQDHPRIHHREFDWDPVPYYGAMDIVTLLTYREGFGIALLEAGCMELPAVATRATGSIDAVVDGQTGILVDIEDVDGTRSALVRLLDDPDLRRKMGRSARLRVEAQFSDDRLLAEHFRLYAALLAKNTNCAAVGPPSSA
ncbi:MAG: glycosyltransferase family 4 protein [Phycisphaerae bacterium]